MNLSKTDPKSQELLDSLFVAVRRGDLNFVRAALAQVPRFLYAEDPDEDTLVHAAAYSNQPAILDFLANEGANIEQAGCAAQLPIDVAAYEGHLDCVKVLLHHGADFEWEDALKENALHKAAGRGRIEILHLLLQKSRAPDLVNQQNVLGSTPLHVAMERGYGECAEMLLAAGADPTVEDHFGFRPTFIPRREQRPQFFSFR